MAWYWIALIAYGGLVFINSVYIATMVDDGKWLKQFIRAVLHLSFIGIVVFPIFILLGFGLRTIESSKYE